MTDKDCPICKGTGFVDKGKTVELCECRFRTEDILSKLNIPKRFETAELDNYKRVSPIHQQVYEVGKTFVLRFDPNEGRGLTLIGPARTGKTHLVVGILKALYRDKRIRGLFCDTKDMLFQLKLHINNEVEYNKLLKSILNVPVLALDGLGSERLSDWNVEIISHIITHRYNHNLSTLITTNYKLHNSKNDLSSLEERFSLGIVDRIVQMTTVITLDLGGFF